MEILLKSYRRHRLKIVIGMSDHAMNAIDEMSALNRDLKKFFDEHGEVYPVWQALEAEAGRYLQ